MDVGVWYTYEEKNGKNGHVQEPIPEQPEESRDEARYNIQETCMQHMQRAMLVCGCWAPVYDGSCKAKAIVMYRAVILIITLLYLAKNISAFWYIDAAMMPAQVSYLLWCMSGVTNYLIGIRAGYRKHNHNGGQQLWDELIPKLYKLGTGIEVKKIQRSQVILLTVAILINVLVVLVHVAHVPDKPVVAVFEPYFITAPFEPTMQNKIIVSLMTVVQMGLYSIPVFYVISLSIILKMNFEAFAKHLDSEICASGCKIPDSFQELRMLHNSLCGLVADLDKDLKLYYGNSFVWKMLLSLVNLYMLVKADLDLAGQIATVYFFIMAIGFLLALSICAALVNEGAHAPLDTIYYINVGDITMEKLAQINLFLSKLTGTQVGFSTCGLLVITKEFILTIAGVFLTYFAVLYTL